MKIKSLLVGILSLFISCLVMVSTTDSASAAISARVEGDYKIIRFGDVKKPHNVIKGGVFLDLLGATVRVERFEGDQLSGNMGLYNGYLIDVKPGSSYSNFSSKKWPLFFLWALEDYNTATVSTPFMDIDNLGFSANGKSIEIWNYADPEETTGRLNNVLVMMRIN